MASSAVVVAGTDILASAYNNLRSDVLDPATGHDHEGIDGKTLNLNLAIPAVTATPAEINQALDGISANVTDTNLNTLTAGAGSDGSSLHTHETLIPGLNCFWINSNDTISDFCPSGFDDENKIIGLVCADLGATEAYRKSWKVSQDVGSAIYDDEDGTLTIGALADELWGSISINGAFWYSDLDGTTDELYKDSVACSFSGTDGHGALGYDPTNSYLLILADTTHIYRYSGIAGTTVTYVDAITLDTAVTWTNGPSGAGFLYDDTNQRYICVDKANNLIRRFDSAGNTIDTVAYTIDDTNLRGLCIIGGRVYLVLTTVSTTFANNLVVFTSFVPTSMLI